MIIAGIQKTSLIDFPQEICTTIFTKGCNFACHFCHNPQTLCKSTKSVITLDNFLNYLKERQGKIDAVCISGGEPTLQKDLESVIVKIKELNYKVKLDSNGSKPTIIKNLLNKGYLDYIAIDIKAPLDKYNQIIDTLSFDTNKILNTIEIVKNSSINYEFRTTFLPVFNKDDILSIVELIKYSKRYVLQQFRNIITLDPNYQTLQPHSREFLFEVYDEIKSYFDECILK